MKESGLLEKDEQSIDSHDIPSIAVLELYGTTLVSACLENIFERVLSSQHLSLVRYLQL